MPYFPTRPEQGWAPSRGGSHQAGAPPQHYVNAVQSPERPDQQDAARTATTGAQTQVQGRRSTQDPPHRWVTHSHIRARYNLGS